MNQMNDFPTLCEQTSEGAKVNLQRRERIESKINTLRNQVENM